MCDSCAPIKRASASWRKSENPGALWLNPLLIGPFNPRAEARHEKFMDVTAQRLCVKAFFILQSCSGSVMCVQYSYGTRRVTDEVWKFDFGKNSNGENTFPSVCMNISFFTPNLSLASIFCGYLSLHRYFKAPASTYYIIFGHSGVHTGPTNRVTFHVHKLISNRKKDKKWLVNQR